MLLRAALRGCGARGDWQRPIVPQGCRCSIVGAGGLHDRVRDGNGCVPSAVVTNPPASHNSRESRTNALKNLRDGRPRWDALPGAVGGDEGTRTPDPLDANQMLSQLSYAPRRQTNQIANRTGNVRVGLPWLEQGTSVLSGLRSNQLSYRPASGNRWTMPRDNRRVRNNLAPCVNRCVKPRLCDVWSHIWWLLYTSTWK